jgi:hypothetical protein
VEFIELNPPKFLLLPTGKARVDHICYVDDSHTEEFLLEKFPKAKCHQLNYAKMLEFSSVEDLQKAKESTEITLREYVHRTIGCIVRNLRNIVEELVATVPKSHIVQFLKPNLMLWFDAGYEDGQKVTIVRVGLHHPLFPECRSRSIRWIVLQGGEKELFRIQDIVNDGLEDVLRDTFGHNNVRIQLNYVLVVCDEKAAGIHSQCVITFVCNCCRSTVIDWHKTVFDFQSADLSWRAMHFYAARAELCTIAASPDWKQLEIYLRTGKPSWRTVSDDYSGEATESDMKRFMQLFSMATTRAEIVDIMENNTNYTKKSVGTLVSLCFQEHYYSQGVPLFSTIGSLESRIKMISPPMHVIMGMAQNVLIILKATTTCSLFKDPEQVCPVDIDFEEDLKNTKYSGRWSKNNSKLRGLLSHVALPFSGVQKRLSNITMLFHWLQHEIYLVPDPNTGKNPTGTNGEMMFQVCSLLFWGLMGYTHGCVYPNDKEAPTDILEMTCIQMKAKLKENNVAFKSTDRKRDLQMLLLHHVFTTGVVTSDIRAVEPAEPTIIIQGCTCGENIPFHLPEKEFSTFAKTNLACCRQCKAYFHKLCENILTVDAKWMCSSCIYTMKPPSLYGKIKMHKFAVEMVQLRKEYGTLRPFVSFEEDGEGAFGRTDVRMSGQSNFSDESFVKAMVSEEQHRLWEQRYADSKSAFHRHYFKTIKDGDFCNLVVYRCVWNSWEHLLNNWMHMMRSMAKTSDAKLIYHSRTTKALLFKWAPHTSDTHYMCFCAKDTHAPPNDFIPLKESLHPYNYSN